MNENDPESEIDENGDTDPPKTARGDQTFESASDKISSGEDGDTVEVPGEDDPNQTVRIDQTIEFSDQDRNKIDGSDANADDVDLNKTARIDQTIEIESGRQADATDAGVDPSVDQSDPNKTVKIDQTVEFDPASQGAFVHASAKTVQIDQTIEFSNDESTAPIDKRKTIDPESSVLDGNNVTRTLDMRALSDSDQQIWGMTTNLGGDSGSPDPKVRPLLDRKDITESQMIVPSRQLADLRTGEKIGSDYELVKVLGEGGMGTVYLARQTSLDRFVALKMVRDIEPDRVEHLRTTGKLSRTEKHRRDQFLAEAIVTGDLDHPNIVPIHDLAVSDSNALFYAMKKVDGTPWSEVIADKTIDENLEILLKVSDAIGFAHARGIVHRDIKPENVMLGDFGVVMLMDWGLAVPKEEFRARSSIQGATTLGGSPAYMAPEMATGPVESIGPGSDIYLLGAVLFEIVTGRTPHGGNNLTACLRAAMSNEIVDVSNRYDGELMRIARKAMADIPEDRYASAASFQEAIRDYRSSAESISLTVRANDDLRKGQQSQEYTDFARSTFGYEEALNLWPSNEIAQAGLVSARLAYAQAAHRKEDYELGLSLLDPEDASHIDLIADLRAGQKLRDSRQGRLTMVKRIAAGLLGFILVGGSGAMYKISLEKNNAEVARDRANQNARLAAASEQRAVEALALVEEEKLEVERQRQIAVAETIKADQQRQLATESAALAKRNAQEARDAEQDAKKSEQEARDAEQVAKKAERDAKKSEKLAQQKTIEAKQQKTIAEYEAYIAQIGLAKARIDQNEFDDARRILGEIKKSLPEDQPPSWEWQWLWQQANQAEDVQPLDAAGQDLAMDSDGQRAIVTLEDGTVNILSIDESGKVRPDLGRALPNDAATTTTAISPNGALIAAAGKDGQIRLWDARSRGSVGLLRGHQGEVTSVTFVDDRRLVSTSRDRTVRFWDVQDQKQLAEGWHIAAVHAASVALVDGRLRVIAAVADQQSGRAVVWEIESVDRPKFRRAGDFLEHSSPVFAVALSPDGTQAASGDRSGKVLVWNPSDVAAIDYGSEITKAIKSLSDNRVASNSIKPRKTLARSLSDNSVADPLQLVSIGQPASRLAHQDAVESLQFSHDGSQLLSTSDDYTIKLWNVESGQLQKTLRGHGGWVRDAVFFPGEGGRILSAGNDAAVRAWAPAIYRQTTMLREGSPKRLTLAHDDEIWSASFDPAGQRIVTASRDHTARVIRIDRSTVSFAESTALIDENDRLSEGSTYVAMSLAVDGDRNRLFIGSADSTVRLWNIESGSEVAKATGTGLNTTLAVSPDGNFLVTGSSDDDVRAIIWSLSKRGEFSVHSRLREHESAVTAIAVSPDSKVIFTGDRNGVGLLWNAKTGRLNGKPVDVHRGFRINAAAFSPDGKQLLIAADDRNLSRIDLSNRETIDLLPHPGFVTKVSLSSDGKFAATLAESAKDGIIKTTAMLWDLSSGSEKTLDESVWTSDPSPRRERLVSVRFGQTPGKLITASRRGDTSIVKVWSVGRNRQQVRTLEMPASLSALTDAQPLVGNRMISLNGDSTFLWNLQSLRHIRSYRSHGGITEADFSADGRYVVTGSRSIKIWDSTTGKSLAKMESPHEGAVRSVQFSPVPDGYLFASGGDDGTGRLWQWDPKTAEITKVRSIRVKGDPPKPIRQIRFSPSGRQLLVAYDDAVARVWQVDGTSKPREFRDKDTERPFLCGDFSADEEWIVVGCEDRQARIWRTDGQPVADAKSMIVLQGHADRIEDVGFLGTDPRFMRVMTASLDKSARIWDPRFGSSDGRGREILALRKHTLGVTTVDATADGTLLMTAGRDGNIILWPTGGEGPAADR